MSQNTSIKSAKPAFIAYQVRNKDGQSDGFWTRIGVAFPHADGKGYNLLLDVVPLDGQVTLRTPADTREEPE